MGATQNAGGGGMALVKITDVSGQLDISSRSLRYYEEIGLIQSVRPPFEKYRFYDTQTVERIRQIVVLRKMQIPIKDILRIYESRDMRVLVETFVGRLQAIDREMGTLGDLRRIVDGFLQAMVQNGVRHLSALPLMYDKLYKNEGKPGAESYENLSAAAEALASPPDVCVVELKPMRMLSSRRKDTDVSDAVDFWAWLQREGIEPGAPGTRTLFETQDEENRPVLLQKIDDHFVNGGPFADILFKGGLFAAFGAYADEDLPALQRAVVRRFDENPSYEVDYRRDGRLRHKTLLESLLSADERRQRLDVLIPVKRRLPNATLYEAGTPVTGLSEAEIEAANPILWANDIPMDGFEPILSPHYRVNADGEAEFIPSIDKRLLSTKTAVRIPFRVDITFRIDDLSATFAHGSDEGSLRFYHDHRLFGINMDNNADPQFSREAIRFEQPIFGDAHIYPGRGRIEAGVHNRLTWIVGEKHFAVVVNGEVRHCEIDMPYMYADLRGQTPRPILLGSNGSNKIFFRAVRVSQLKSTPQLAMKGGVSMSAQGRSNNVIPHIHQLITMHYGENYWFNGCAKYVMECLGEPALDYWFFSGLTGDHLSQVFARDRFRGDGATDYLVCAERGGFIENVFARCGYESTYVPQEDVRANLDFYLQKLMADIDRGVPVIRSFYGWGVFVGYEEYGKTLLYLTADKPEPERIPAEAFFTSKHNAYQGHTVAETDEQADFAGYGWCFVGEKTRDVKTDDLYREVVFDMPRLLTTDEGDYCFGAAAFRAWADEVEGGRFAAMKPEDFESFEEWATYKIYVCNVATNGSCREFLARALQKNPDLAFLGEIIDQYKLLAALWNGNDGENRRGMECLESLGGGFNATLEALSDPVRRGKIAGKIRACAAAMDRVLEIFEENAGAHI